MPRTQKCTHIASDKVPSHETTRKIRSAYRSKPKAPTLMAGVSPLVWRNYAPPRFSRPWLIDVFFGCAYSGVTGYCMPRCGVWCCAIVLLCAQTLAFRPRYSLSRFGTRRFARMSAVEGEAARPPLTFVTGNAKKLEVRRLCSTLSCNSGCNELIRGAFPFSNDRYTLRRFARSWDPTSHTRSRHKRSTCQSSRSGCSQNT